MFRRATLLFIVKGKRFLHRSLSEVEAPVSHSGSFSNNGAGKLGHFLFYQDLRSSGALLPGTFYFRFSVAIC
jgi:hypothetical protein